MSFFFCAFCFPYFIRRRPPCFHSSAHNTLFSIDSHFYVPGIPTGISKLQPRHPRGFVTFALPHFPICFHLPSPVNTTAFNDTPYSIGRTKKPISKSLGIATSIGDRSRVMACKIDVNRPAAYNSHDSGKGPRPGNGVRPVYTRNTG